jgi:hypothetical protein
MDMDFIRDRHEEAKLAAAEDRAAARNDFIAAVWQALDSGMDEDDMRDQFDQALTTWQPGTRPEPEWPDDSHRVGTGV